MKKAIIIGSGFAGLSAASFLAKAGFSVTLLEKNSQTGGRARQFKTENGFVFDMGPSWYWMPDVFERFFEQFGKQVTDYYTLDRLDPSYRVVYRDHESVDIPASMESLYALFEHYEKGSSAQLKAFLEEAKYKYEVGINDLVHKPSLSLTEFLDIRLLKGLFKMDVFNDMSSAIRKRFKHPKLIELLEFPVLFLGAMPNKTPALYSLMNYADMVLGTWYPKGGMHEIIKGMTALAESLGVTIQTNSPVSEIVVAGGTVTGVNVNSSFMEADVVVGAADYNHIEQELLPPNCRNYSQKYWDSRTMAPSSLLFYIGVDRKVPNLLHHNLFFDSDFTLHAEEIYEDPKWPSDPLFYASCPSKTDSTVAPEGMENLFLLIPVAPDLDDSEETRAHYFEVLMKRLQKHTGVDLRNHIVYKRSFAHADFKSEYHAFKGNAYGLANTLKQTAILKPSLKNKKLSNLYYTGQLTVPGPGVPPSLISGEVVAQQVVQHFNA